MSKKNLRVCQRCKVRDTHVDDMEFEIVGKKRKVRKYYHKQCYAEHINEKKFKQDEAEKLDKLKNTIEEIYNIKMLPQQAYPFLQKIRNGENVFGGRNRNENRKRYKEGYGYDVIERAYKICEKTIQYYNKNKFNNSSTGFMNVFKYGLTIIMDKLHIAERNIAREKMNKSMINNSLEMMIDGSDGSHDAFESSYKKKDKEELDLTDFLD